VYKLFLTLRYLRKRRIAYFAIAAVTLCVAMVLIVMSVMGGFLEQLKFKARGLLGDIVIDNPSYSGFPLYQEFIDEVKDWPEIVQATPVIYSFGLVRFKETEQTSLVRVVGIRLEEVYEVNAFRESLYYERHYPGTTTLAEQQQPVLGIAPDTAPPGERKPPEPRLPEPFWSALQKSRAAGIRDEDSAETELNQFLHANDMAEIPGVFDVNPEVDERPGALVERPPAFVGSPFPGLILGRDIIARRLPDARYKRYSAYPRGCVLTVTVLPMDPVDPTPVKQPFRYADDSRTGIYEIDSQHVYCDFNLLQRLLMMDEAERADGTGRIPARCSQIQIKIADGVEPLALAKRLQQRYHELADDPRFNLDLTDRAAVERTESLTWEQSQAHVIGPVEKERQLVTILFGIVSLVAAVLVLCILYMIVLQKTRDIGVIKSLGGSSGGVAWIFLCYGAAVGIVGSALGTILGWNFVTYINEIQAFLTDLNPAWQVWDRSVYSFDEIPNQVQSWDVLVVIASAIAASTGGALLAALRAGFMQPVESLRYE